MRISRVWPLFLCALCIFFAAHSRANPLSSMHAVRAEELTLGLDLDLARKELEQGDAGDAAIRREKGRLALYEADCDGAVAQLSAGIDASDEEAAGLLEIAKGCARVTAATVVDDVPGKDLSIRYQDELDRALTPLIADVVVKARESLTRDLGATWPKPTRVIVVRDLLSLSAMTGLPYESAQTTGTVAVAKWGRVTLLSPRASHHGYVYTDTLAHELTHLTVTRLTVDRAPLWLQEGLAKREETRWREKGPFDDRPTPDAVARRGIDKKLDLALDKLGPSIAMLPSAEAAMVAFAEVTSFVRFYARTAGDDAVRQLLAELRAKKSVDAALSSASGTDLKGWDAKWRAEIMGLPSEPVLGLDRPASDPKAAAALRDRLRLAELLLGRDHAREAQKELDPVATNAMVAHDPTFSYLGARVAERSGELDVARAKVADPKDVTSTYAPWWAIRGRLADAPGGERALVDPSFAEAVGEDPFDVEAACRSLDRQAPLPQDPTLGALCAAARARGEPDLGQN